MAGDFSSGWLSKWWFRNLLVFCLFLVIGFSIYWNSLGNSFQFDDEVVITYNRNVRSLGNVINFFTDPGTISADPHSVRHYRPVVVLSYAINYAIGGYSPAVFHATNIVIHIATAFLLFLILKAMLGTGNESHSANYAAMAAGLIFLTHPFNSEAVNYLTARFGVMSSFFYLLAFYCWICFRSQETEVRNQKSYFLPLTSIFYLSSILSFVAAMLCKEIAVTLPAVLWLYDMYDFSKGNKGTSEEHGIRNVPYSGFRIPQLFNLRNYIPYLPFILIVIVPYLIIRLVAYHSVLSPFQRSIFIQLMTEAPVLIKHWQLFIFPYPLTIGHLTNIQNSFWSFPVIYSSVILISYVAIAVLFYRTFINKWKVVSFFMFWFFIVLLPTTVLPLNTIFQENRGYLAAISFAVLVGVVLSLMKDARLHYPAIIALAIILAVYSVFTIKQNKIWKDEISLWGDAVIKYPDSPMSYTALGIAYRRAGMIDKSLEASRRALILGGQDNHFAHENLAEIYVAQEKWDLAAQELEITIKGYQFKPHNHNELGMAYYKTGRMELAERQYKEAISLDQMYYQPWFNLGVLYVHQGRQSDAVKAFKNVLVLNPSHIKSMFQLGLLYERLEEKKEAKAYYNNILQQSDNMEEELVKGAAERLKIMELRL